VDEVGDEHSGLFAFPHFFLQRHSFFVAQLDLSVRRS
jgi:hypothetical protein